MNRYTNQWDQLCNRFLPIGDDSSIWRYSRTTTSKDPVQGWKLHIGATILTAGRALELIGPVLTDLDVLFKGPRSLEELCRLNSGVHYGYTQVGKCFTIYPPNDDSVLKLANELSALLKGMPSPTIPFDERFASDSPLFYRYGSFKAQSTNTNAEPQRKTLLDPFGNEVEDRRDSPEPPSWVKNPFLSRSSAGNKSGQTSYRVVRALQQRGKGGVYLAVDFGSDEPQMCVLKEGRLHGEVTFDGRDGYWRVEQEKNILQDLASAGVQVPVVLSSFEADNHFYLALEHIEGKRLDKLLSQRKRKLTIRQAIEHALEIARILEAIHKAGYVWRDCKPANLIVVKKNNFRPIDFEGACRIGDPNPIPWGTRSYVPKEAADTADSQPCGDIYSLGVITFNLLSGQFPNADSPVPIQRLRRGITLELQELVSDMLNQDPSKRPSVGSVVVAFSRFLLNQ